MSVNMSRKGSPTPGAHAGSNFLSVKVRLLIAGRPWCDRDPYQSPIDELDLGGRVRCVLDYVGDEALAPLFAAADLVVLPHTP